MKKKTKTYFRTLYLSSVIAFCLCFAFIGISKAYENMRLIGFGEYRKSIEITKEEIKIFDFIIKR